MNLFPSFATRRPGGPNLGPNPLSSTEFPIKTRLFGKLVCPMWAGSKLGLRLTPNMWLPTQWTSRYAEKRNTHATSSSQNSSDGPRVLFRPPDRTVVRIGTSSSALPIGNIGNLFQRVRCHCPRTEISASKILPCPDSQNFYTIHSKTVGW